jgi:hypothetical protein
VVIPALNRRGRSTSAKSRRYQNHRVRAKNCPISGANLPFVVVSHGKGNHFVLHHDTAETCGSLCRLMMARSGGCWSPGSSPGMIAREGWPTPGNTWSQPVTGGAPLCSVIGPSKDVAGYDGCPSRLRGRAGIDVISPQGGESGDIEKLLLNIAALDGKRICIIPSRPLAQVYLPVS